MKTIQEYLAFVKEQIAFHEARVELYGKQKARKNKHMQTLLAFQDLKAFLEKLESETLAQPKQLTLNLRPEDLEGLPEELVAELSITSTDKAEFLIMSIMEKAGGTMSLDQILVQYYKETGEILKRVAMTNRIYRMAQKDMVFSVPQKKGVYSLAQESDELTDKAGTSQVAEKQLTAE